MKKIAAALLIVLLFLASCSDKSAKSYTESDTFAPQASKAPAETVKESVIEDEKNTAGDDMEKQYPDIGIYIDETGNDDYVLCEKLEKQWISGKDIACFAAIPSLEKTLSGGSYKNIWLNERESNFKEPFKIGYTLDYTLKNGENNTVNIKAPSDAEGDFTKFLEVYLYDDIHKEDGVWYSHLLENEMNDETVITSFKLTAGTDIEEVLSASLTVFSYGEDGARGSGFTVEIVNTENK